MYNRDVLPHVSVELTPPPCKRTFYLTLRNDVLTGVSIDGVHYATRLTKRGGRFLPGTRIVPLVNVIVNLPDA